MKLVLFIFFHFLSTLCSSQSNGLLLGNTVKICLPDSSAIIWHTSDSMPAQLDDYELIFLFSNAASIFSDAEMDSLLLYVFQGGNLYCGAENPPFNQEVNSISEKLFGQHAYGVFPDDSVQISDASFLKKENEKEIYAGDTPTALPLNMHVKVEVWISDQPLITSLKFGTGFILFDGGYSRFYCSRGEDGKKMFSLFVKHLLDHTD